MAATDWPAANSNVYLSICGNKRDTVFCFIDNFSLRNYGPIIDLFALLLQMDHLILTKNFHFAHFHWLVIKCQMDWAQKVPSTIWNAVTLSFHWLRKCIYCLLNFPIRKYTKFDLHSKWRHEQIIIRHFDCNQFWMGCAIDVAILLIIIYVLKHEIHLRTEWISFDAFNMDSLAASTGRIDLFYRSKPPQWDAVIKMAGLIFC